MRSSRPSPFEVLLGDMADLPEPVRRFHSLRVPLVTRGRAEITQASSWKARLICLLAGLPRSGRDVACSVVFTPLGDGREHWARDFAGRPYRSVMRAFFPSPRMRSEGWGEGQTESAALEAAPQDSSASAPHPSPLPVKDGERGSPHLIERFGPLGVFDLHFRLTPTARGLEWSLTGWDLLGLALPAASVPRIACLESADGDRFHFDIDVAFPLIGPVIHYSGWLEAEARSA